MDVIKKDSPVCMRVKTEKKFCTMGTLHVHFTLFCLISLQIHLKLRAKPIYLCVDSLSLFFVYSLSFTFFDLLCYFFYAVFVLVACSSQICVAHFVHLLSPKPQPCFSHCDLVGDFLSSVLCSLRKNYMTSRIN